MEAQYDICLSVILQMIYTENYFLHLLKYFFFTYFHVYSYILFICHGGLIKQTHKMN